MEIVYMVLAGAVIGGLYGFIVYKKQNKNNSKGKK